MFPGFEKIIYRNGSFPDAGQARDGLAEVLQLAEGGKATNAEVVEALLAIVDQLGNEMEPVPEPYRDQLTDWAERAATDPAVPAMSVAVLLVNARTPRSYATLQSFAAGATGATRPDLAQSAQTVLPDHPLAPARA